MMRSDDKYEYGKAAYYKTEELSARLSALEKSDEEPVFNEVEAYEKIYKTAGAKKTITINCAVEHTADMSVTMGGSTEATLIVKINGTELSQMGENEYFPTFKKGKNEITFEFEGGYSGWLTLSAMLRGYLDYVKPDMRVKACGGNHYNVLDGDTFYVYNTNDMGTPKFVFYNVLDGESWISTWSYIVLVLKDGSLNIRRYYGNSQSNNFFCGSGYKCCQPYAYGARIYLYSVRSNHLCVDEINARGALTLRSTEYRAADISFNCYENEVYMVVTTPSGSSSLMRFTRNNYLTPAEKHTIGKVKNPKVCIDGGNVSVWHHKDGFVFEKAFNGIDFADDTIRYESDEGVMLTDGQTLVRYGDEIQLIT
ncbi:MAG: hypothetical protein IJ706_01925 [Clostridia bacterium]|nr:hypothetical protein [Clostridia bacterium]